ncbi:site-specific integrase [Collimonas fungivorans]|uniref:Site-specific recombinase, phage integrase family n=1 Tax=Collimonas fungivorans (strain Ter331) TaxID=1005048 RepID=G0AC58_COLFT|nr:site-specific integrase [Collimonas fungivorans]AEK62413.1 site-specific recombinase, phage integrase family [Collimonas fungivorans Ter331]
MENLANPLKNIRKPAGSRARNRRLETGEYDLILGRLKASENPYAACAFDLAIETSLRQGMLFKVRWEWVNLSARMIRFPASTVEISNKGVPAALPLSRRAIEVLQSICPRNDKGEIVQPSAGLVLATTANAIICIWKRALAKVKIEDLRWHDLRHEAASRLFEKGFHPMEVASITGHKSMQMLKRYTHLKPESLLERLG